jgi:hypothetical protein
MNQHKSGLEEKEGSDSGTYFHIFTYRIPKRKHDALLSLQKKLGKLYKKHGMLGSQTLQLGKTNVFDGFSGFDKALGTSEGEEIWLEVDSYKNASEFNRIVAEIGEDEKAGPLWGRARTDYNRTPDSYGRVCSAGEGVALQMSDSAQAITDAYMQDMLTKTKPYTVMILRKTFKHSEPGTEKIIWEHGRRNFELRRDGKLCVVCPVRDGTDVTGVGIFATDPEETRRMYDDDPGVKAGIFVCEIHPTRTFPGDVLQ